MFGRVLEHLEATLPKCHTKVGGSLRYLMIDKHWLTLNDKCQGLALYTGHSIIDNGRDSSWVSVQVNQNVTLWDYGARFPR